MFYYHTYSGGNLGNIYENVHISICANVDEIIETNDIL